MIRASPGVAVIVPAFNAATTLPAALGSIAGQLVEPEEVVVVDDGSSDDTVEVAERWRALLPMRVVQMPANGGPGRARNEGVRRSSAAMLAFLDADDIWFPNHLATCLALQARTGGVASGRGLRWHETGGILAGQVDDAKVDTPGDVGLEWLIRHHTFGMHAVMPRSIFEAVGGFDPAMEGVEDWDLWVRISEQGMPLRRTSTRTFLYRQHDGNLSLQVDRIGDAGLRLLDRVARDHQPLDKGLRVAIRDSRALIAFNRAYRRLDAGEFGSARRCALKALPGPPALSVRAAALVVAPRLSASFRGRRRTGAPSGAAPVDVVDVPKTWPE